MLNMEKISGKSPSPLLLKLLSEAAAAWRQIQVFKEVKVFTLI